MHNMNKMQIVADLIEIISTKVFKQYKLKINNEISTSTSTRNFH